MSPHRTFTTDERGEREERQAGGGRDRGHLTVVLHSISVFFRTSASRMAPGGKDGSMLEKIREMPHIMLPSWKVTRFKEEQQKSK